MAILSRQSLPPRVDDSVQIPGLRFAQLGIDFGSHDDPRLRITADVEAFVSDQSSLRAIHDAGAIVIGPKASLFALEPQSGRLRLERSIELERPYSSRPPMLRASGQVYTESRDGSVVIIAHSRSPFQRRPWRITIEMDRGERIASNWYPGMSRPVSFLGY